MNYRKAVGLAVSGLFSAWAAAQMINDPILLHQDLPLAQGSWAAQGEGEYFTRTGAWDDDGQELKVDDFKRKQAQIDFKYGLTDKIFGDAGLRYRQNAGLETSRGFESVFARLGYGDQINQRWMAALVLQWRHPLFSLERNQTYLGLGDDGDELSVQGTIFYRAKAPYLTSLSVAYVVPHELSPEIDAELQQIIVLAKKPAADFQYALGGGVDAVISLRNGPYQQDPTQRPPKWPSTNLYRSFNRQWVMPFAKIIAGDKTWTTTIKGGLVVQGRSTDKGWAASVLLTWRGGGVSPLEKKVANFKEYTVEALAIKVSPRGKFIKIDQGLRDGVDRGAPADIYQTDYLGKNILFASGEIYQVGDTWAIVRILQKFKIEPLQTGMVVRVR